MEKGAGRVERVEVSLGREVEGGLASVAGDVAHRAKARRSRARVAARGCQTASRSLDPPLHSPPPPAPESKVVC